MKPAVYLLLHFGNTRKTQKCPSSYWWAVGKKKESHWENGLIQPAGCPKRGMNLPSGSHPPQPLEGPSWASCQRAPWKRPRIPQMSSLLPQSLPALLSVSQAPHYDSLVFSAVLPPTWTWTWVICVN